MKVKLNYDLGNSNNQKGTTKRQLSKRNSKDSQLSRKSSSQTFGTRRSSSLSRRSSKEYQPSKKSSTQRLEGHRSSSQGFQDSQLSFQNFENELNSSLSGSNSTQYPNAPPQELLPEKYDQTGILDFKPIVVYRDKDQNHLQVVSYDNGNNIPIDTAGRSANELLGTSPEAKIKDAPGNSFNVKLPYKKGKNLFYLIPASRSMQHRSGNVLNQLHKCNKGSHVVRTSGQSLADPPRPSLITGEHIPQEMNTETLHSDQHQYANNFSPLQSDQMTYAPDHNSSDQVTYIPDYNSSDQIAYAPDHNSSDQMTYAPAHNRSDQVTYAPGYNSSDQMIYAPDHNSSDQMTYAPAHNSDDQVTYAPYYNSSDHMTYAPDHNSSDHMTYATDNKSSVIGQQQTVYGSIQHDEEVRAYLEGVVEDSRRRLQNEQYPGGQMNITNSQCSRVESRPSQSSRDQSRRNIYPESQTSQIRHSGMQGRHNQLFLGEKQDGQPFGSQMRRQLYAKNNKRQRENCTCKVSHSGIQSRHMQCLDSRLRHNNSGSITQPNNHILSNQIGDSQFLGYNVPHTQFMAYDHASRRRTQRLYPQNHDCFGGCYDCEYDDDVGDVEEYYRSTGMSKPIKFIDENLKPKRLTSSDGLSNLVLFSEGGSVRGK